MVPGGDVAHVASDDVERVWKPSHGNALVVARLGPKSFEVGIGQVLEGSDAVVSTGSFEFVGVDHCDDR